MNMQTLRAAVSMAAIIIVNLCAMVGLTFDVDIVADALCVVVMVASTAWGCWKNHNFTTAAQEAYEIFKAIKAELSNNRGDDNEQ